MAAQRKVDKDQVLHEMYIRASALQEEVTDLEERMRYLVGAVGGMREVLKMVCELMAAKEKS